MKKTLARYHVGLRRVPQRTCVACRRTKDKWDLIRLVRTTGGDIEIDRTGRKEGRGAYICPDPACWEKALKEKQLALHLRGRLTRENRDRLMQESADFIKGVVSAQG
jgi:predicted RNA-binding protein YlxR (DUF448 family)